MIAILGALTALLALALAPFFLLMGAVLAAAVLDRLMRPWFQPSNGPAPRFLLVIPAHNEEALIAGTVQGCLAVDYSHDLFTVHVIADNCSDQTAARAREAGARVYERFDPNLKSKGHALESFFATIPEAHHETGTYDAAVLVDADTEVDPQLLHVFADSLYRGQDWVQAYYTVSNADVSWRTRLMTYAFSLANGVWMRGLDRLGLSVGLKGNGMCFARRGLIRFPWKAYGLVEDMEFALMLRSAGERVHFRPEAVVRGEMVSQGGPAAESQRIRWEAGRRDLRTKFRRTLLQSSHLGPIRKLIYLIDLAFPPLGLLVIQTAVLTGLVAAWIGMRAYRGVSDPTPDWLGNALVGVWLLDISLLGLYLLSPFLVMRLPVRYLGALLAAPAYLAWKMVRVMGRKPRSWVRTPREASIKTATQRPEETL